MRDQQNRKHNTPYAVEGVVLFAGTPSGFAVLLRFAIKRGRGTAEGAAAEFCEIRVVACYQALWLLAWVQLQTAQRFLTWGLAGLPCSFLKMKNSKFTRTTHCQHHTKTHLFGATRHLASTCKPLERDQGGLVGIGGFFSTTALAKQHLYLRHPPPDNVSNGA